jgi:hypothetical protein
MPIDLLRVMLMTGVANSRVKMAVVVVSRVKVDDLAVLVKDGMKTVKRVCTMAVHLAGVPISHVLVRNLAKRVQVTGQVAQDRVKIAHLGANQGVNLAKNSQNRVK